MQSDDAGNVELKRRFASLCPDWSDNGER